MKTVELREIDVYQLCKNLHRWYEDGLLCVPEQDAIRIVFKYKADLLNVQDYGTFDFFDGRKIALKRELNVKITPKTQQDNEQTILSWIEANK